MSNGEGAGIRPMKHIDILLVEYNNLRSEIRTFIRQLVPLLSIYGTMVLGSLYAIFSKNVSDSDAIKFVFMAIPIFILLIGSFAVSITYLIAALAGRVRQIENEICIMNGGNRILKWESAVVPVVVFKICGIMKMNHLIVPFFNPIAVTVIYIILTAVLTIVLAFVKMYVLLSHHAFVLYAAAVAMLFVIALVQAAAFYPLGKEMDKIQGNA